MQTKDWRGVAELIGVAAIVASLFFVGLQIRQSRDVALSELDVSLNANDIEIAAVIGDHPDIWIAASAGAEMDVADRAFFSRLIKGIDGRFLTSWRRNMRFGRERVAAYNAAEFAIFLHNNPGAKRTWVSNMEEIRSRLPELGLNSGGNEFRNAVRTNLDKLAKPKD